MQTPNLPKTYNPKEVEDKIYRLWEKGDYFNPRQNAKSKPFVTVMPPPNITGSLHLGHALNSTILDILTRKARMEGRPALWVPGIDHAGIATQNVIEKQLQKEGKTRFDLGREKFIQRIWQWKEKYGQIIIKQLKKMGCSSDWSRQRFTMDADYAKAVQSAFIHYYKKGLIYQGERVINWCPRCQTSLSDLELEYKEIKGKLWYIRYPLVGCRLPAADQKAIDGSQSTVGYIIVATTRPETMLGDTAVAVNPKDRRYKNLIGKKVNLPLVNREIPIIEDSLVDPKFGTGAVKVTPAHDANDFEIGERHKLPKIKVLDEKGNIAQKNGKYAGLNRLKAREEILKDLEKLHLLQKTEDYTHQIPHCYRCGTIIEHLPSKQWFLKMEPLKKQAIALVKQNRIKFVPSRFKKIYLNWMENLKDWCISRQIWWGHPMPIWRPKLKTKFYVGDKPPKGYVQIDDVLDTWFSSALWPFAVFLKRTSSKPGLKTQNKKLKRAIDIFGKDLISDDLTYFYPTTLLCTAREILFLWVARMIFSGIEFMGEIPFETVYIHPVVLAESGKKMSKSLGTGIDPLELIDKYGADALRFGIAWQLTGLQDLRFKEDTMVAARNFCNKLWNISRFILINLGKSKIKDKRLKIQIKTQKEPEPITKADKDILASLKKTIRLVNQDLDHFRFGQAAQALYHFTWHKFADIYIEESKQQLADDKLEGNTHKILLYVLTSLLKLLHPFMPFITEEIWQQITSTSQKLPGEKELLIVSSWPK